MKYVFVSVAILVVSLLVTFVAYRLREFPNQDRGGFRDWVKNPDYKQVAADYFAARDSLEVPDDISTDEIQQMVDRLFVQEDEDFNLDQLRLVGTKAVPMLIAALEDPKTRSAKFNDGGHVLDAKSPFERMVDLLEPLGPAEAAVSVAKYIDHEDDHFRKYAAITLGNIGTAECIAPMLKALDDDDDSVRTFAMMGVQRGMKAKRCTKEFLDAMFPALTRLLNRDDSSVSGVAPELLLAIDKDRASTVLLSPEYFCVENREVHHIIHALNATGHKVPHKMLLPFLERIKPMASTYPHGYHYSEALIAYAHNPDELAEKIFRTELKSPDAGIQEAAATALAVLAGVTNARQVVYEALESQGFEHLSTPQQHYYAVLIYDAEVNNGGHSQYFVNSSGSRWKTALDGLKAIGAEKRAEILQKASALFGSSGPSTDHEKRHQQIASFTAQQDELLDKLDRGYYSCDEPIETLLAQYALENKEHFTARQ